MGLMALVFSQGGNEMEERIAEVLINRPSKHLNRTFTYRIPDSLSFLGEGWRCVVPFGKHAEEGIIISVHKEETSALKYKLKDITGSVDDFPWFTKPMLETALWISNYYLTTLIDALRLFLIDKKGIRTSSYYEIHWNRIPENHSIRALIDESITEISENDSLLLWTPKEIHDMLHDGYLVMREEVRSAYRVPLVRWIAPVMEIPEEERKRKKKQALLSDFLMEHGEVSVKDAEEEGFSPSVLRDFCNNGYGRFFYKKKATYSLIEETAENKLRELTDEQKNAVTKISEAMDKKDYSAILLMGVTGSGKTEVYVRAAEKALKEGGSVIILVPEIALTLQMVTYFAKRFGDEVIFIHSNLSKGERYNNRMRVERGESHVIIGSRSALFMPLKNLRLLVVDEEYDSSYKSDETPRYNGRDVAKMMAVIYKCPIILGAATPAVDTYYAAKTGKLELIPMKHRVHNTPLPEIVTIDMRETQGHNFSSIYSDALLRLIKRTIDAGKKAIVFLNRRGYATTISCETCGYVFKCPHCDVSLVYHKAKNRLMCHYCESSFPLPHECPRCHGHVLTYKGKGTEKIEESLSRLLPEAKIARLDLDTTQRKHSARDILDGFRKGKTNVLLGTQMVAKGHDIPDVDTIGIVAIDNILNMPTYLASEQTFNLITQCAGRAGRSLERGHVILQTYTPENFVIQTAARQDYEAFYKEEIEFRKALFYPPFARMIKISSFGSNYEKVRNQAQRIYAVLSHAKGEDRSIQITPPYDEPIKKIRDVFYISIMIRGSKLSGLKNIMRLDKVFTENGIIIDVDPL